MRIKQVHRLAQWVENLPIKGGAQVATLLARCLLPRPTGPIVLQTVHGFPLRINPVGDGGVEEALYQKGSYEKGTLAVMAALLRPGDQVADVGANIGLMSVFAALRVGEQGCVWAFEPNPPVRDSLAANVALNQLPQVEVSALALSDRAGEAWLQYNRHINRGAAALGAADAAHPAGCMVRTARLADLVPRPPRLLKIDVEGHELAVLRGCAPYFRSDAARPFLILEFEPKHPQAGPLWAFLLEKGYNLYRLRRGKGLHSRLVPAQRPTDFPTQDNLFCFPAGSEGDFPLLFGPQAARASAIFLH
jgi:FkbM family methyltransferase